MSSKDSILASIRRHTGARHEMPELTLEAITYADKLATFSEVLAGAGGKAIELKPGEDVCGSLFPKNGRLRLPSVIMSSCLAKLKNNSLSLRLKIYSISFWT